MKKKQLIAKALCVLLSGVMVFSLTSCNKGGTASKGNSSGLVAEASDAKASKDAVFRLDKKIELDFEPASMYVQGDQILFFTPYYDDGSAYGEEFEFEEGGEITEETETSEPSETEDAVTEEGSEEVSREEEITEETAGETSETETPEEESEPADTEPGESTYRFAWVTGDINGNIGDTVVYEGTYSSDMSFSVESSALTPDGKLTLVLMFYDYVKQESAYKLYKISTDGSDASEEDIKLSGITNVDRVIIASNGMLCVYGDGKILLFDETLKQISEIPADRINGLNTFAVTDNGKYYIAVYTESYDIAICELDLNAKAIGPEIILPSGLGYNIMPAKGHDFYSKSDKGVSLIDIHGNVADSKMIFNFTDSDIMGYLARSAFLVDEETVILLMDEENGDSGIYKKVPPEQIKDKKIITLGSIYSTPYDVQKRILEFNKKSEDTRIRTVSYSDFYTDDDPLAPEKQFRNDILSKAGPDIIITSGMIDSGVYASKGVFADMYPYFDKNGINKEDFLTNVLDAGSYDGKLYILMPQFSIEGLSVKESMLNGKPGFTMDEFIKLEEQHNCKGSGIVGSSRNDLLQYALVFSSNSYYDVNTGECNFNSESFINTLKWIKEYPETIEEADDYREYMKDQELSVRNGKALARLEYFYSFRDFNQLEQVTYGDNVALTGFPGCDDPASGVIMADLGFAISALGDNQDEAFDFIKYYLSDEYQMPKESDDSLYYIPISKKALDAKIAIECDKPFDYDEKTGKKKYYDEMAYSYAKGDDVKIQPLSPERAEKVKEFIYNTHYCTNYDQKIIDIVKEEAAPFFNNQKSAEDVANIIQSRVSIYVHENQ